MQRTFTEKVEILRDVVSNYGRDLVIGLLVLIGGVLAIKYLIKGFNILLVRFGVSSETTTIVLRVATIILYIFLLVLTASILGFNTRNLFRFLIILTLLIVVIVMIFKPYLPRLPFKPGQTIKTGEMLGKVEATTFLNTRMRTFDGKTVWIPNSKVLNDYVINYHITPSRRIKLDVRIRYDQDLMKAKQVMEKIMVEDPRVLTKPRPVVWVIKLAEDAVVLGGRCWVENLKFWRTRCELLEKIKLTFDNEGILFALPQRYVYVHGDGRTSPGQKSEPSCSNKPNGASMEEEAKI